MNFLMLKLFRRNKRKKIKQEIAPEEIFLDSSNIPLFDQDQMEGRIEKAISQRYIGVLGTLLIFVGLFFWGRAYFLQIENGDFYRNKSQNNHLRNTTIFADRGLIVDRNGALLAWNTPPENEESYSNRKYIEAGGFGNLLGFIKYPAKDSNGFFYQEELTGRDGIEAYFNTLLAGKNGLKIVETDARGNIESQSSIRPPEEGKKLILSIDADVQKSLFKNIQQTVTTSGFVGGGGIIMDIHTGEVLAVTTYPEYSSEVMTNGKDSDLISSYFQDKRNLFLDRAISGLYAPGSIMKPFIALGALNDGVVSPDKKIESKGSISVPNPYDPEKPTIFRDWRVNGWTDIKEALAVSSDVYFYAIGGGYEDQKGMGISAIDKYVSLFGFGKGVSDSFFSIKNNGVVPTPEWKSKMFNGDMWRLGDTYNSSIGQFGFQVTAVQAVRAVAAIANGGTLLDPQIIKKDEEGAVVIKPTTIQGIDTQNYTTVKQGMRLAVTAGTLTLLNYPDIEIAAKSGTAEVGSEKRYINSWVTGFFPYEDPKYAFAFIMEKGPAQYREGASGAAQRFFNDMNMATTTRAYLR